MQRYSIKLRHSQFALQIPMTDEYSNNQKYYSSMLKIMRQVYSIAMLVTTIRPYSKDYVCVCDIKMYIEHVNTQL